MPNSTVAEAIHMIQSVGVLPIPSDACVNNVFNILFPPLSTPYVLVTASFYFLETSLVLYCILRLEQMSILLWR